MTAMVTVSTNNNIRTIFSTDFFFCMKKEITYLMIGRNLSVSKSPLKMKTDIRKKKNGKQKLTKKSLERLQILRFQKVLYIK